jgi:hypothetical protein
VPAAARRADFGVICGNLSTHQAPVVHRWLLAHPRFVLHFTPTYSSWISHVERWLAEWQRRSPTAGCSARWTISPPRSKSGSSSGTNTPGPSPGPKTADQIIGRIGRCCARISEPAH